ncbi:MAG: hypothetical protein PHZ19_03700 [Candidatus Thermoplasmatota archaeon]|nr:hypothetical protein [Candidatus Thermoplasmatota archaeon]
MIQIQNLNPVEVEQQMEPTRARKMQSGAVLVTVSNKATRLCKKNRLANYSSELGTIRLDVQVRGWGHEWDRYERSGSWQQGGGIVTRYERQWPILKPSSFARKAQLVRRECGDERTILIPVNCVQDAGRIDLPTGRGKKAVGVARMADVLAKHEVPVTHATVNALLAPRDLTTTRQFVLAVLKECGWKQNGSVCKQPVFQRVASTVPKWLKRYGQKKKRKTRKRKPARRVRGHGT